MREGLLVCEVVTSSPSSEKQETFVEFGKPSKGFRIFDLSYLAEKRCGCALNVQPGGLQLIILSSCMLEIKLDLAKPVCVGRAMDGNNSGVADRSVHARDEGAPALAIGQQAFGTGGGCGRS